MLTELNGGNNHPFKTGKAGIKAEKSPPLENRFFLNVGHGNFVAIEKVLAILGADSSPMKRIIHEAQKKGTLLDATYGRRTRSVVVLEGGVMVLSALNPDTMAHRYGGNKRG